MSCPSCAGTLLDQYGESCSVCVDGVTAVRRLTSGCTDAGCGQPVMAACTFELGGHKRGRRCCRGICQAHEIKNGGRCGPHARLASRTQ